MNDKPLVLLDPGHGTGWRKWWGLSRDTGTDGGGLNEPDVVLQVGKLAYWYLEQAGCRVEMSRWSTDYSIELGPSARGRWAAARPFDAFVSIHLDGGSPSLRGCSAFYPNEQSPASKALARMLAASIRDGLGVPFSYDKDDGALVHWTGLGVFTGGNAQGQPGALCLTEGCFMSNAADLALIKRKDFCDRYARALKEGIVRYLTTAHRLGG